MVGKQILVQEANGAVAGLGNTALVGLVFPVDQAQEGRFSCAVQANEADFLLGFDVQRSTVVERAVAEVIAEVGYRNHAAKVRRKC